MTDIFERARNLAATRGVITIVDKSITEEKLKSLRDAFRAAIATMDPNLVIVAPKEPVDVSDRRRR
jgi:hypothetical protein